MKYFVIFFTLLWFLMIPVSAESFAEESFNGYSSIGNSPQEPSSENQFHEGHVEWISRCFMVGSDVVLRVTDPDMNRDPEFVENLNVTMWSDNDDREVAYTLTETGKDTGIFDANVFFTRGDSSPGKRLRIIDDSTISAKYVDYTFLESNKKIDVINSVTTSGLSVLERHADNSISKIIYDPCALILFAKNPDKFEQMGVFYPAPLKQIESGLSVDEVRCKESLSLVQKYDGTPACMSLKSAQTLYERGWTPNLHVIVNWDNSTVHFSPVDIASANNLFAFKFYSQVSQDKENNVFFSPTSIFTAFAIAYEGAKDNTAHEIQSVFLFDPDDTKRRADFASMQKQLNMKEQNNTLSLSNALWIAENFEVLPEYIDTAKTYYNSDVESVDFTSKENSLDIINQWIDAKTEGKITKIFKELAPATELVITNAIYFKGMWDEPFDNDKTLIGDFHVTPETIVQVPMMESKTIFPNVAVNDLVKIVELPYEGEKLSMLILLPRDENQMQYLENSLSMEIIDQWKQDLQTKKTKVYMPKFEIETEYDLKSILQEMGIRDAFNDADFTGISNSGLYIEKATHKAIVEVTEEGTEAAAATGLMTLSSGPYEFIADRPFIFMIQDNETESILFMGKVVDPLQ